jgi:hypothetical protein
VPFVAQRLSDLGELEIVRQPACLLTLQGTRLYTPGNPRQAFAQDDTGVSVEVSDGQSLRA